MRASRRLLSVAAFLCCAAPAAAEPAPPPAAAVPLVRDAAGTGWLPVPALATDVELRVAGVVARGRVVQRFRNPTGRWLEALYVFPLPETAAVDHMELHVGDRVIEGRIQEREQAKQSYERAKNEGRQASLVEQERPDVFHVSIANLGPGEVLEVSLDYQDAVRFDAGAFRLRFPTVVAPRYAPGVPDAARISPPVLHPDDGPVNPVRIRVELDPGFPLASLASPSHVVHVAELGGGRAAGGA